MTVRRDLDALARQGVVEKVHGGAVPVVEASSHEPGFEAKSGLELGAKEAIGRAAAALVPPGSAIALAGGTTAFALAHHLLDVPDLTVVTNSVRVADVFQSQRRPGAGHGDASATVVITGRSPTGRSSPCTSTCSSSGCTASRSRRACPRRTWRRPRPTGSSSARPGGWW
jgi:hypothetical protein